MDKPSSPCHHCRRHFDAVDKETHPDCRECHAAKAYSESIGPMVAGIDGDIAAPAPPFPVDPDQLPTEIVYPFDVVSDVCEQYRIDPDRLTQGDRRKPIILARAEIVRRLWQTRLTHSQVARLVGVAEGTVYQLQVRLGLRRPKKKGSKTKY